MGTIHIILLVVCVIMLLLVSIFIKNRLNKIENVAYMFLLVFAIIGFVMQTITFLLMIGNVENYIETYSIFSKLLYGCYGAWMFMFTIYYLIVSIKEEKREKIGALILKFSSILLFALFLIYIILPMNILYKDGMYIPVGSPIIFIYISIAVFTIISLVLIVVNKRKFKDKKYWPLLFIIMFFIITLIVNDNYFDLTIVNQSAILLTFIMFFTMDNPDVKLIENLNLAKTEADRANSAKSDFLSNMSHEIRTPLNAIVSFSNVMKDMDNMPEEAKEDLEYVLISSNALLELVNGILDISKIEANKLEIVEGPYKFIDLFNQLVTLSKARLNGKNLDFNYSYDDKIPEYLFGDMIRVKQVILNLLTNAIKYTHNGYIDFKIDSFLKKDTIRLIIVVEDSGIGIKAENYSKLFTKFERIEEDGNTQIEGTGLGLAITKNLVELMGGKIVVRSTYGKGSTFIIALEQKFVDPKTIQQLELENNSKIEVSLDTIKGKRVLIVDDNKMNLKVAEKLLKPYELALTMITSGSECIEKIKNKEVYDLILMDDLMPNMSGGETLSKLREISGFNIPVVMLTANVIGSKKEIYLSQGFSDYLSKPIERNELDRVLKKFLNK